MRRKVISSATLMSVVLSTIFSLSAIYSGIGVAKADSVIATIPVGREPLAIAFDSANGNLYVANTEDNTVSVISGNTNTVIGNPIPVGQNPFDIAFDSLNGNLYVTNLDNMGTDNVLVISGQTNTVIGNPQANGLLVDGLELQGQIKTYENTNQIDSCNPRKNPTSIGRSCDASLSFIYEVCKGYPRASDPLCSSPIPNQVLTFRHYNENARSQLAWYDWDLDISVMTPGQSSIDIPILNVTNSNN